MIIRIAALLLLLAAASPSIAQMLEVDRSPLDFGTVQAGTVLTFKREIRNASNQALRMGARPTCDCVSADPERLDLPGWRAANLSVTVNTEGRSGEFAEKLYLQSNDPANPYIALEIKGYVTGGSTSTIAAVLFHSPGCRLCLELKTGIIPQLERRFGVQLALTEYNVNEPENFERLIALERRYNRELNDMPVLFIGTDVLGGRREILASLPSVLEKYAHNRERANAAAMAGAEVAGITEKLRLVPLIAAGVLDGINPCAFATIIVFLSYLSLVLKLSRTRIFLSGAIFIAGVFVTYYAIGLGLFAALHRFSGIRALSDLMYGGVGAITIALAGLHARDTVLLARGGKPGESAAGMPAGLRRLVHALVARFSALSLPLIFLLAAAVTVLELVCTGQVYLPAILYLVAMPEFKTLGLAYLALYCFLFVLPLIAVFTLFYYGLTTERLKRFFRERIVIAKAAMSVFFLAMGVMLLLEAF